jgi:hypothetical protein
MATIHYDPTGSSPRAFHHFPPRIASRMPAGGALSPTVGDILSPELLASLRGEGGPTPLWSTVLAAARPLATSEAERALLEQTRLLEFVDADIFVIVTAERVTLQQRATVRWLLTDAVRLAGLSGLRVRLRFTSTLDGDDGD